MDLRRYREVAGKNIEYSLTEENLSTICPAEAEVSQVICGSAPVAASRLANRSFFTREDIWFKTMPAVRYGPDMGRNVDPECLRRLLQALRLREAIEVRYQSLTNTRWREDRASRARL